MRNRLAKSVMVLATIAMVVSMVAALTPDASAQDSLTAPDGLSKWMRYNMPAAKDLEATTYAIPVDGMSKTCCITVLPGSIPSPDTEIGSASAASSTPYSSPSRWFCMGDPR
jgi:hypothetical protein